MAAMRVLVVDDEDPGAVTMNAKLDRLEDSSVAVTNPTAEPRHDNCCDAGPQRWGL